MNAKLSLAGNDVPKLSLGTRFKRGQFKAILT
jgi:hypothetical protein